MAQTNSENPSPRGDANDPAAKLEKATFGSGCFWCTEAVFQQLRGVKSVVSGYSGGSVENPTYERLLRQHRPRRSDSDHVRPDGDFVRRPPESLLADARPDDAQPARPRRRHAIPLGRFLSQRRAAPSGRAVQEAARRLRRVRRRSSPRSRRSRTSSRPRTITRIISALNPAQSYCQFVIRPKVEKFNKEFKELLKKEYGGQYSIGRSKWA